MRPTARTFLAFLMALPFAVIIAATAPALSNVIWLYLAIVAILVTMDSLQCRHFDQLVIQINEPSALYIGQEDALSVSVTGIADLHAPTMEVACQVNQIIDQDAQNKRSIQSGQEVVDIPLKALRRGEARISEVWFRWTGPLGLMARQTVEKTDLVIPVLPDIKGAMQATLDIMVGGADEFGERNHPQQGMGSEFHSLRDYLPGMDPRTIDWKRSARYRTVMVKEYEAERNHQVIIGFDTGHLMTETIDGLTRLDHAVNAGMALAHMALRGGDKVGLYAFDSQVRCFVRPVSGMTAMPHLQSHLSKLDYSDDETNFTLGLTRLIERLNRRSLVVLFTDFIDTTTSELMRENLAHLALHHLVVFVTLRDPLLNKASDKMPETVKDIAGAVTARELVKEREILLTSLRQSGVLCLETQKGELISKLLKQYSAIVNREMI